MAGTVMNSLTSSLDLAPTTAMQLLATNNTTATDHTYRKSTFVQTAAGEGIAGVCVWAAIIITCHQARQTKINGLVSIA